MLKESFIIYTSFSKPLSLLSDKQLGRLFRALFQYNLGEVVEVDSDIRMAYEFIINQFEIDEQKRQERIAKNIENGRRGGIARSEKRSDLGKDDEAMLDNSSKAKGRLKNEAGLENSSEAKGRLKIQAYNENENENDNKETANAVKKSAPRFSPPTVEDVAAYITEKGYTFTAESFCDFYESKGWMVGRNKMKDWQAAVRNWQRGESERRCRNGTSTTNRDADKAERLADAVEAMQRIKAKGGDGGEPLW